MFFLFFFLWVLGLTHTSLNVHMIRPQDSTRCCDKKERKKKNANEILSPSASQNGILPFLWATQIVAVYTSVAASAAAAARQSSVTALA